MELLDLSKDPLAPLPLLPAAGGSAPGSSALKTSSLSRMGELQQFLRQCGDQNYLKNYIKVLSAMPRDLLDDLARQIKARSAWLSSEEQREYKRAKLLNVMGAPCSPVQHRAGGACAAAAADADAFCSEVLGGCGSGEAAAAGACTAEELGLERLEMLVEPQQHAFVTPGAQRVLAAGAAKQAHQRQRDARPPAGGDASADEQPSPDAGTPDGEPAAAGVTEHNVSPDDQPAATPQLILQQHAQLAGGGGRGRQATLQLPKH